MAHNTHPRGMSVVEVFLHGFKSTLEKTVSHRMY